MPGSGKASKMPKDILIATFRAINREHVIAIKVDLLTCLSQSGVPQNYKHATSVKVPQKELQHNVKYRFYNRRHGWTDGQMNEWTDGLDEQTD